MSEQIADISTPNAFSMHIEKLALEKRLSRWDTILEYCATNFIDVVEIVPILNKSLIEKIAIELQAEGKLPQTTSATVC